MAAFQGPGTPGSTGQPSTGGGGGLNRRDFLAAAGLGGAALVVPAIAIRSTRPAWLAGPGSSPSNADWNALRSQLSSHRLYRPGESGYDQAKKLFDPDFNSLEPAGVAYCKSPTDVGACITFATKFKLPFRMRSGGHSYAGYSSVNGGLIIDVSLMDFFFIGPGTAEVGAGMDLINFYNNLAHHGVAVPGGSCPTVGITGLTLGGGIGVLARLYGLTCDSLDSVQMVLADGSHVTATPKNAHSDLLWASQGGGGGNFGVTTALTFRTHTAPNIWIFNLRWPWSHAARVVNGWQNWIATAPDALWSNLFLGAPFGGAPDPVFAGGTFVGSGSALHAQLDRLYHLVGVGPAGASMNEHSFLQAMLIFAGCSQVAGCDTPPGGHLAFTPFYAKSDFFTRKFDSAGIHALMAGIERLRGLRGAAGGAGSIAFDGLGGAVNRVKADATAFVHRNAFFDAQYYTGWNNPGSASGKASQFNWLTSYHNSMRPYASGQAYQNYIDPTLTNWRQAYYGGNYPRLSEIKQKYDPHQVFNFPQAITPPKSVPCDSPDC